VRRELRPDLSGVGFVQGGSHKRLLFARATAGIGAQQPRGAKARGFVKPAGEYGFFAQCYRFAREGDENSLRHVMRVAVVAGAAARRGITKIAVPPHQFSEGTFGIVVAISKAGGSQRPTVREDRDQEEVSPGAGRWNWFQRINMHTTR